MFYDKHIGHLVSDTFPYLIVNKMGIHPAQITIFIPISAPAVEDVKLLFQLSYMLQLLQPDASISCMHHIVIMVKGPSPVHTFTGNCLQHT